MVKKTGYIGQASRSAQLALLWLIIFAFGLTPETAFAHRSSTAYGKLILSEELATITLALSLRDLETAIGLDLNLDGAITWGEIKSSTARIDQYVQAGLSLSQGKQSCSLSRQALQINRLREGNYLVLKFLGRCPQLLAQLPPILRYSLFFERDLQHRLILSASSGVATIPAIISPDSTSFELSNLLTLNAQSSWVTFGEFFKHGVWHIWIGYDHILFLLALLLPSVLLYQNDKWVPIEQARSGLGEVIAVVTAFTLAHSVTLSIAALELVIIPSQLVESAIAASVLLAALNNLHRFLGRRRWIVAFVFGLIHGFGFASVLAELGLPREDLILSLVSFNLGVEFGQLAIVSLFFPVAYALRRTYFYQFGVLKLGSAAVAIISLLWLLERSFDISFF